MLEQLKQTVYEANIELHRSALVRMTWGNVSGIDRKQGLVVIKPSGVAYDELSQDHMVVVGLDGSIVESGLRPSSDTPTHLVLYRAFKGIGGITHTHSVHAAVFAQACREIPCLGTTHADHFAGTVPIARVLTEEEVLEDYEGNTGHIIVERFKDIDPVEMPGVLVPHHGPFTWGKDAADSVKNSVALETVAEMALGVYQLDPGISSMPEHIRNKHYTRKHGKDAYYGQ